MAEAKLITELDGIPVEPRYRVTALEIQSLGGWAETYGAMASGVETRDLNTRVDRMLRWVLEEVCQFVRRAPPTFPEPTSCAVENALWRLVVALTHNDYLNGRTKTDDRTVVEDFAQRPDMFDAKFDFLKIVLRSSSAPEDHTVFLRLFCLVPHYPLSWDSRSTYRDLLNYVAVARNLPLLHVDWDLVFHAVVHENEYKLIIRPSFGETNWLASLFRPRHTLVDCLLGEIGTEDQFFLPQDLQATNDLQQRLCHKSLK